MVLMAFGVFAAGLKILEDLTKNSVLKQQQVLEEILTRNVNSLSSSSGRKKKLVPSIAKYIDKKLSSAHLMSLVMMKHLDGLTQGKWMYLFFTKLDIKTPSRLMPRTFLTSLIKAAQQKNSSESKIYASLIETVLCLDSKQSLYCQLFCGLVQQDYVIVVGSSFASTFLKAISFLEDHCEELCSNKKTGHLSDWITDLGCRNQVSLIISTPNLELADLLEQACSSKSWEGIVEELWPRAKYTDTVVTGSKVQYIPSLEFYGGGLPLISQLYASSEYYFGIN
ncbi:hypothetical protein SLEP1_g9550 [Rubroshorea leprosula]|uniref:Uncharacterized protein n=1 Tax=Rubroshorea leprosula TaxID=152421 RepID=A0AAV5IAZ0_9ROSI|nr:hypothetical protein SLEP1_g9550 [Rubroshorea leprosula]